MNNVLSFLRICIVVFIIAILAQSSLCNAFYADPILSVAP